jgi:hypothetical protein
MLCPLFADSYSIRPLKSEMISGQDNFAERMGHSGCAFFAQPTGTECVHMVQVRIE